MANTAIAFDVPDLAVRIEQVSQAQLNQLTFGVILLDHEGIVRFFNTTEARLSDFGTAPLGQKFFEEPLCVKKREIQTRITRAMENGPVDLDFGWKGDHADPKRDLRIRVQSSRNGGVWMFIARD
jgi:photoactive yellow protein